MSIIQMQISIPPDNDGYILFQCPLCNNYFKLTADDCENDGFLEFYCSSCGLRSDNYITEDVLDLARVMAGNYARDIIYKEMQGWGKQFNKGIMSFSAGKKPTLEHESPIYAGIEALTISFFDCCKKSSKIKPLFRMTGCYCPFCGVKNYEIES